VRPGQTLYLLKKETRASLGQYCSPRLKKFIDCLELKDSFEDMEEYTGFQLNELMSMASLLAQHFGAVLGNPISPLSIYTLNHRAPLSKLSRLGKKDRDVDLLEILANHFNGLYFAQSNKLVEIRIFRHLVNQRLIREVKTFVVPLAEPDSSDPLRAHIWDRVKAGPVLLEGHKTLFDHKIKPVLECLEKWDGRFWSLIRC
jgi:hypothetical protein